MGKGEILAQSPLALLEWSLGHRPAAIVCDIDGTLSEIAPTPAEARLAPGAREALHRLLLRAGLAVTDDDRARIQACTDLATLDRWFDNVLGAASTAAVLAG